MISWILPLIAITALSVGSDSAEPVLISAFKIHQSEVYREIVDGEQLSRDILVLIRGQTANRISQAERQQQLEEEEYSELPPADQAKLRRMQGQKRDSLDIAAFRKELAEQERNSHHLPPL